MTRHRFMITALICAGALLASGCGVPSDGSPRPVADDDLPASLRSAPPTSTTPAQTPDETASVYLIRGDSLVRVDDVSSGSDLEAMLDVLQRGPTAAQAKAGNRSAFTDLDLIRGSEVEGSTAVIDLEPAFADVSHQDQILGLGQLVLTATDRPGVKAVRITVAGEETEVPAGDGTLTSGTLTRADYASFVRR